MQAPAALLLRSVRTSKSSSDLGNLYSNDTVTCLAIDVEPDLGGALNRHKRHSQISSSSFRRASICFTEAHKVAYTFIPHKIPYILVFFGQSFRWASLQWTMWVSWNWSLGLGRRNPRIVPFLDQIRSLRRNQKSSTRLRTTQMETLTFSEIA